MKTTVSISLCAATVLLLSCASTPKNTAQASDITLDASSASVSKTQNQPTRSELYAEKISSINISLISSPKETVKKKIFTSPYTLKVVDSNGNPADSFELAVSYPSGRENGLVVFSETSVTTNADGIATFLPPTPEYAFNSEISFFPKYDDTGLSEEELAKIKQSAEQSAVKAPFKVQTNLKSAGGVIAIVDFNQNGKAITSNPISSSNLLMTLMKFGFIKIGNAPQEISDAVIQNNEEKILSRAKQITNSFIIFGTVTIDSAEKSDKGFTYTLTGTVKALDVKTGSAIFYTQKTISVTDKNDWNALANARKTLADTLANEITYGI